MKKFESQVQNEEVFCMFGFLKKSRAVRFLCSACLICSLGSFANICSAGERTGDQIGELYVKGELGYDKDKIFLFEPSLSSSGLLTGILKYATARDNTSSPDESTAETLWNDLEDAEITIFLRDMNGKYIAASAGITFTGNSDEDKYTISTQLYRLTNSAAPAKVTDTQNAEKLTSLMPGKYAVTGIVTKEGITSIISGPVLTSNNP